MTLFGKCQLSYLADKKAEHMLYVYHDLWLIVLQNFHVSLRWNLSFFILKMWPSFDVIVLSDI